MPAGVGRRDAGRLAKLNDDVEAVSVVVLRRLKGFVLVNLSKASEKEDLRWVVFGLPAHALSAFEVGDAIVSSKI